MENEKNQPQKYWLIGVIIGLLLSIIFTWLLNAIFASWLSSSDRPYVLEESLSPTGKHSVKIIADGEARWPFGPQSILVQLDNNSSYLSVKDIKTKGRDFKNYYIIWDANCAKITLETDKGILTYDVVFSDTDEIMITMQETQ